MILGLLSTNDVDLDPVTGNQESGSPGDGHGQVGTLPDLEGQEGAT